MAVLAGFEDESEGCDNRDRLAVEHEGPEAPLLNGLKGCPTDVEGSVDGSRFGNLAVFGDGGFDVDCAVHSDVSIAWVDGLRS